MIERQKEKILVAYASRCGSTAEVAKVTAASLVAAGWQAEAKPVGSIHELSGYSAVVLGSAVRAGKWLPEAVAFVKKHRQELHQVPVAYFSVCLTMKDGTDEAVRRSLTFSQAACDLVRPLDQGVFAGVVSFRDFPWIARWIMKKAKVEEGDYRDWTAIRAWATNLPAILREPELICA